VGNFPHPAQIIYFLIAGFLDMLDGQVARRAAKKPREPAFRRAFLRFDVGTAMRTWPLYMGLAGVLTR